MSNERLGGAIHSAVLTGDPEGFGDKSLGEPLHERPTGALSARGTQVSVVSRAEVVRDDPLGYADAGPASLPGLDRP